MRLFIGGIVATLAAGAVVVATIWFLVLPRLDWGAANPPGAVEEALAHNVLGRWIHRGAQPKTNPLAPTAENLSSAKSEFEEHCVPCHALDGSARNQFEADFYPPVMKLTGDVQKLSDGDIYFIVAHGIRYTAMPAFGKTHSPADIWRLVLWVRHLGNLTPAEKPQSSSRSNMRP